MEATSVATEVAVADGAGEARIVQSAIRDPSIHVPSTGEVPTEGAVTVLYSGFGGSISGRAFLAPGELPIAASSETGLARSAFGESAGNSQWVRSAGTSVDSPSLAWKTGTSIVEDSGSVPSTVANEELTPFYQVASGGVRGELPLSVEQRAQVEGYLKNFDMQDVNVRWVDDLNLNTGYSPDVWPQRSPNRIGCCAR